MIKYYKVNNKHVFRKSDGTSFELTNDEVTEMFNNCYDIENNIYFEQCEQEDILDDDNSEANLNVLVKQAQELDMGY